MMILKGDHIMQKYHNVRASFANREICAILLVAFLLCSLCACGRDSASQGEGHKANNNSTSASADISPAVQNERTYRVRIVTSCGADGEIYYRHEYIYNDDGSSSITSYRADGSESGHVDIVHDEYGNALISYGRNGLGSLNGFPNPNQDTGKVWPVQYEYEYDATGNISKKIITQSNSRLYQDIYEYVYDDAGRQINIKSYSEFEGEYYSGRPYTETSNEYDSNGNLIKTEKQEIRTLDIQDGDPFYVVSSVTLYEYNNDGLLTVSRTKQESYDYANGKTEPFISSNETLYEYDSEGREIKRENYYYEGEEIYSMYTCTEQEWGDDGKLLRISKSDHDGLYEYTVYYYDEQGRKSASERYIAVYRNHPEKQSQIIMFERLEYTYTT